MGDPAPPGPGEDAVVCCPITPAGMPPLGWLVVGVDIEIVTMLAHRI